MQEIQQIIPKAQFVAVSGNHNSASGTKEFAKAIVQFLQKSKK